jgi:hypothetical protein
LLAASAAIAFGALLQATLLGFAGSSRLTSWVDAGRTRRAVLAITVASGIAAVLRSLA